MFVSNKQWVFASFLINSWINFLFCVEQCRRYANYKKNQTKQFIFSLYAYASRTMVQVQVHLNTSIVFLALCSRLLLTRLFISLQKLMIISIRQCFNHHLFNLKSWFVPLFQVTSVHCTLQWTHNSIIFSFSIELIFSSLSRISHHFFDSRNNCVDLTVIVRERIYIGWRATIEPWLSWLVKITNEKKSHNSNGISLFALVYHCINNNNNLILNGRWTSVGRAIDTRYWFALSTCVWSTECGALSLAFNLERNYNN